MTKQTAQILTTLDINVETFVDMAIYDACLNNHNVLRISTDAFEEGEMGSLIKRGFTLSPPLSHNNREVIEIRWRMDRSIKHQAISAILNLN